MKKIKIGAFLRPAIYTDIFDKETDHFFKKNVQYFEKQKDNSIRGPYSVSIPDFFTSVEYDNYLQLIKEQRIFVVDGNQYQESILVKMPLREAVIEDLLEYNHYNKIEINKIFYIITSEVSGPFKITESTVQFDVRRYMKQKQLYILDYVSNLKIIVTKTAAEAV